MEKLNQYIISEIIRYLWVSTQLKSIQSWRRASKSCFHNFPNKNHASFWFFVLENLDLIHPDVPCSKSSFTGDSCWWLEKAVKHLGEKKITHLTLTGCPQCDFQLWKQIQRSELIHLTKVSNVCEEHQSLFLGGFKLFCPSAKITLSFRWNPVIHTNCEEFVRHLVRKLRRHPTSWFTEMHRLLLPALINQLGFASFSKLFPPSRFFPFVVGIFRSIFHT